MEQYYDYNARLSVPDKVFTPQHGVTLRDGLFMDVFENNVAFLEGLDLDRMLYWFRRKSGIATDAKPFTGHFEDNLKGQTASLFLMGAGNALRWKEVPALREKLNAILDGMEGAAEPDGFMFPIDKRDFATREYPGYVRIWLNYGLMAAGSAGVGRAFEMLRRWQDWFNTCPDLPILKYLTLAFQGVVASTAVYTTPVGTSDDIEVTRRYYEEPWRLAQFIGRERDAVHVRRQHGYEPHPHGTEIEAFEGYLDLYRATGAPYLLNGVLGGIELYKQDWQHPGGGIAMCEFLDAEPGSYWITPRKPYNELCCSAFWIWLHQRLHRLDPDREEHVAEIEKSLYNIAIANQAGSEGIRYFAHLEQKKNEAGQVTCCAGVGTKIYGSLPEYLYSVSPGTVYVDLYAASELEWQTEAQTVRLTTDTQMPYDGRVAITVKLERPQQFTVRLRMPGWASGRVEVTVNGQPAATGEPGTYLALESEWADGDRVEFTLPMDFRLRQYTGFDKLVGYDRYSIEYGPLLLAVEGEADYLTTVVLDGKAADFPRKLRRSDEPLCFAIDGKPNHRLVPYFGIGGDVPFTCFPVFHSAEKPG